MSKLLEIEAYNFVTYKHFKLDLSNDDSVFISGKNLDASAIDSNGSGKSLIYDAIIWCLYDITVRGFSKDQVIGKFDNNTWVKEKWIDDSGRIIDITRYRNDPEYKNSCSIYIDGKDSTKVVSLSKSGTNYQITKILNLDSTAFLHSIVFSRNRKSLCDESEAGRRKLLSHILNLDKFDEALKNVRKDKKDLYSSFNTLNIKETSLKTRIKELKDRIISDNIAIRDEVKRVNEEKEKLSKILAEHDDNKRKILNKVSNIKGKLKAIESILIDNKYYRNKIDVLNNKLKINEDKLVHLEILFESEVREIKKYKVDIVDVIAGRNTNCSFCGQKITSAHVRRQVFNLKEKLYKHRNAKTLIQKRSKKITRLINNIKNLLKELDSKIDYSIDAEKAKFDSSLEENIDFLRNLEDSRKDIKVTSNIKKLKLSRNNTKKLLLESIKDLKNVKTKKIKVSNALEISDFWISGFSNKGIKSFIINGILDYLEKTANEYLYELTEGYIKINWISEQEQKTTGKTVDKLILNVKTGKRGNKEYHFCSDGEKARIWLAMELALNAVIRSTIDLALVDEVFDGLDAVGVRRAMSLLTAESSKRKILCISHRKEMEKHFNIKKNIIMENDESRLED